MKPSVDVIILGAKPIKGMKSLGAFSNLKIDRKNTVLDSQISNLNKKLNINKTIYVGGFQSSKIHRDNILLLENHDYEVKNNGASLKLALQHIESDYIFIIFNKILLNHKIFNRYDFEKSFVFINDNELNTYDIGCVINNDTIENIFYNLPNKLSGIYGLSKTEIEILKQIDINDNLFVFEVMNKIIGAGGAFAPKLITGAKDTMNIENTTILKKVKRYYAQNFST
jgi:choline kinase